MSAARPTPSETRLRLAISGQVQGVGFRPHAYRLARELGLAGRVWNDAAGVTVEIQGARGTLEAFRRRLRDELPSLARIDALHSTELPPAAERGPFRIAASRGGPGRAAVTPDTATCPECLAELFDPGNRRYRYPFINCTQCGPRFTIADRLPYDRPNTSMAGFTLCTACAREYRDPGDRRFHAQPNACPECGPRLTLLDGDGRKVAGDPCVTALQRIRAGGIVAVKGLGGFHLACDARRADAVAALRRRKQRDAQPFAVMVANPASLDGLALLETAGAALLASPSRPIVLLPKAAGCDARLPGVAPDVRWLGVLLPYTPLHWLLFHAAAGMPAGLTWSAAAQPLVLVMTSANPHGEPLAIDDDEACARLAGIADLLLVHDRPIRVRCDDSVVQLRDGAPVYVRRARGCVPAALRLPASGPAVLAVGGHLKNTVCVTRGDRAYLSQHVGDLDNARACRALDEAVARLCGLLEIEPTVVARDLHPDYYSSRYAEAYAEARGLACLTVQHHHAHIAALAAEHGVDTPLLGVALDGSGYGDDGAAWGGELLRVDGARWRRLAHLRPLALPGGDAAAREPWRMAAAALAALGRAEMIETRFPGAHGRALRQMLANGTRCPPTTSAGRLFDAVAGLLGIKPRAAFEGQAAMLLEQLAADAWPAAPLPGGYTLGQDGQLDLLPLLGVIAAGSMPPAAAAACFHATLAAGLDAWVGAAAAAHGAACVALGGGCFQNQLLSEALATHLAARGLRVLQAHAVPPGDGGLALGQAWVAVCHARTSRY